jgi:hypothetical protein
MFFGLRYVDAHPLYNIQSALEDFFTHCAQGNAFSIDCFPAWFRPTVMQSPRLKARFESVAQIFHNEDEEARQLGHNVFVNNNEIRRLCEDKAFSLAPISSLSDALQSGVKDLFAFLFDNTLSTRIFLSSIDGHSLTDHYLKFRELNEAVCPFCSMENYPDKSSGTRASYDHYLSRSLYPFAGCNFLNLVPMCKSCNEAPNKRDKDILFMDGAKPRRRQVFFPYENQSGIRLSVLRRKKRSVDSLGTWRVLMEPIRRRADREKLSTSDAVFRLTTRLEARIAEKNATWVKHLIATTFMERPCTITAFRNTLRRQAKILADPSYVRTRSDSLLERAFYSYLATKADKAEIESYRRMSSTEYMTTMARRTLSLR